MKRRKFLQGALAIAAAALLPKAVGLPHFASPLAWGWSEEASVKLREALAKGVDVHRPIVIPDSSQIGEIFWSDDGGVTWKPMGDNDLKWFGFGEPGDTWGV